MYAPDAPCGDCGSGAWRGDCGSGAWRGDCERSLKGGLWAEPEGGIVSGAWRGDCERSLKGGLWAEPEGPMPGDYVIGADADVEAAISTALRHGHQRWNLTTASVNTLMRQVINGLSGCSSHSWSGLTTVLPKSCPNLENIFMLIANFFFFFFSFSSEPPYIRPFMS